MGPSPTSWRMDIVAHGRRGARMSRRVLRAAGDLIQFKLDHLKGSHTSSERVSRVRSKVHSMPSKARAQFCNALAII